MAQEDAHAVPLAGQTLLDEDVANVIESVPCDVECPPEETPLGEKPVELQAAPDSETSDASGEEGAAADAKAAADGGEDPADPEGAADVREADPEGAAGAEDAPEENADEYPIEVMNALSDVFRDVTVQSADSQLVTPSRWEDLGMLPEGMDLLDFGAVVLNFLEDHPETDEPEPEPNPIPDGYDLVEQDGTYVLVQVDPDPPVRRRAIHCSTIRTLMGHDTFYLFDEAKMTAAYANWSFMSLEDDKAMAFVNCVREESRIYPRPMLARTLRKDPFCMTDEEIAETYRVICECGEYPDIATLTASNGDLYYFSTDFLSPGYARALAQWQSVDRWMNT